MSMNTCFECGDVYDTDYQMETNKQGEMVCDNCAEKGIEMEKLYRIDMNVDTSKVLAGLLVDHANKDAEGKAGTFDGCGFFKSIVMQSISQAHPTGSTASLRRTKSLGDKINECTLTGGFLDLNESDYKYIQSALNRADKWNNSFEIATSVLLVVDAVTNAEVVE